MSNRNCLKQHVRTRIDQAIGRHFAELRHAPFTRLAFSNLLQQVRTRSSLLRPTGDGSQQLRALAALRNIARFQGRFVAWPSTWTGGEGSVYTLVHSLASHLFGRYSVPRGFGLVWFGSATHAEITPRRWFIEHASGVRFRDVAGLPMKMTRKMERILLSSPHHLPLRAAMRRAEILGLGGTPELVEVILATSLADDLEHGDFWRSAMHFFINHWDELDPAKIRLIVDYLYAVRIRTREVFTLAGSQFVPPSEPSFSLAGRTPESLLRLMAAQSYQCSSNTIEFRWSSMGLPELCYEDDVGQWRTVELLTATELRTEGHELRHCVGIYWRNCKRGHSSIWSLRWRNDSCSYQPRVTIEVRRPLGMIVQIRGYRNNRVSGRPREIIERWAAHAGLTIPEYAW